jgi:hypothetical protein
MNLLKINGLLRNLVFWFAVINLLAIHDEAFGFTGLFKQIGEAKKFENTNRKLGELSFKIQELENAEKYKDAVPYAEEMLKIR